jgi:hypothetical protein
MIDRSKRILIVVSSHEHWAEAGRKTGYWIGEVSHFAEVNRHRAGLPPHGCGSTPSWARIVATSK